MDICLYTGKNGCFCVKEQYYETPKKSHFGTGAFAAAAVVVVAESTGDKSGREERAEEEEGAG